MNHPRPAHTTIDTATMNAHLSHIDVSVVVIGRNEGQRLAQCLTSVTQAAWGKTRHELVYVDSQSTDTSLVLAQSLGATTLLLADASPCAAKARNLGWQAAKGDFVLFLDGDTQLHPDFVRHALSNLQEAKLCAVWGHRRESRPGQSIYTKVLDLDWIYPTGRTLYFGGDVLVRRSALAQVGGFDGSLKAGEEPELCARLRACGWEIEHIDAPMTQHDLAVNSLRAYWLRAYRSGIAYAEVAQRMRVQGDGLWQHESQRDFRHGMLFMAAPFLLLVSAWLAPVLALAMLALAVLFLLRTAHRCAWKAPGQWLLCMQYAVHTHFQKIPALFGQLKWRKAARQQSEIGLVDYKEEAAQGTFSVKALAARLLAPLAWFQRVLATKGLRVWHLAQLQEGIGRRVDSSNVVMGHVELHGTRNIQFGRNSLIYPGVYLETQGAGSITVGDGVVLSRGVHIVAFERVTLGQGCMVGEYTSIRDANHTLGAPSIRNAGHTSSPVDIGQNTWLGRGTAVLQGASVGANSVVGANAVVTKALGPRQIVGGIPARPLHKSQPLRTQPI